jgi:hypothetical protein
MGEIIDYIIGFMLGDVGKNITRPVGYTFDKSKFDDYRIVIIPSGFFDDDIYGTEKSVPEFPLSEIEGVPFLFGTPEIEKINETVVIRADLVASAYFLLTRYEEFVKRNVRDEHGRFPGKKSLPYLAGFMDRPVVEEYGVLLCKLLVNSKIKLSKPDHSISRVYLTHDVDSPFYCRSWRNVFRVTRETKNPFYAIYQKFKPLIFDNYYKFPFLLQQEERIANAYGEEKCKILLFLKAGGRAKQDRPVYDLQGKDMRKLIQTGEEHKVIFGLHSSYHAGNSLEMLKNEKSRLEKSLGISIVDNRNHFLASREPEDMELLEKSGITDDFTMGYADIAGFRLGTSKPVRFINPATRRLTSLILHPLIIMDSTLSEKKYMDLTCEEAQEYCKKLINNIKQVNGELTLLWHNTSFFIRNDSYLHKLYFNMIEHIIE